MEFVGSFVDMAFGPGDGAVFVLVSVFIGLATGRFSSLWLAVLFAAAIDVSTFGVLDLAEGGSFETLNSQVLDRIAENNGSGILLRSIGYFGAIASIIVLGCALFPKTAISILFGDSYLAMAPLLWKYALATSLFALANIFAYYYLSLDKYIPVVISGVFGLLQMGLVIFFHDSLEQVVLMQIGAMLLLLLVQVAFFVSETLFLKSKGQI